jgi:hypothetical protein
MTTTKKRDVVQFAPNVPVEVALKFAMPGKIISTQSGERVLYTLADDRVMFLDLDVAKKVENLGVNVRDKFFVSRPPAGKKGAEWSVWRTLEPEKLEVEVAAAAKKESLVEEETLLERKLKQSIELVKQGSWENSEMERLRCRPEQVVEHPPRCSPVPQVDTKQSTTEMVAPTVRTEMGTEHPNIPSHQNRRSGRSHCSIRPTRSWTSTPPR